MQMKGRAAVFAVVIGGWVAVALSSVHTTARQAQPAAVPGGAMSSVAIRAVLDKYLHQLPQPADPDCRPVAR